MKITFTDNDGHAINLSGKMQLSELLKLGVKEILLCKPDEPLQNKWYRYSGGGGGIVLPDADTNPKGQNGKVCEPTGGEDVN